MKITTDKKTYTPAETFRWNEQMYAVLQLDNLLFAAFHYESGTIVPNTTYELHKSAKNKCRAIAKKQPQNMDFSKHKIINPLEILLNEKYQLKCKKAREVTAERCRLEKEEEEVQPVIYGTKQRAIKKEAEKEIKRLRIKLNSLPSLISNEATELINKINQLNCI